MSDPTPFEIVREGDVQVATNGDLTVTSLEQDATVVKVRAIKGINVKPAGETAVPLLNGLASKLLENLDMPAFAVVEELQAIIDQIRPTPPERVEGARVRIGDVNVYVNGRDIVVTRQELKP